MSLRVIKAESIGNHFPMVFLEEVSKWSRDPLDIALSKLAIELSSHHFGMGGDGILALGREGDAVRVRMFNPDGTEDFCGNGLRCAALVAHREGWVGESFVLHHLDREVPVTIEGDRIRTTLGHASYHPDKVPHTGVGEWFNLSIWQGMDAGVALNLFGSALTTGSTHVILPIFMLPDEEIFQKVSPQIENDKRFPNRTSVIWCAETGRNELNIRIWERGVGETFGCGTGSSAAAVDYLRRKAGNGPVRVKNRGGEVVVHLDRWDSPITLEGTARIVFEAQWA